MSPREVRKSTLANLSKLPDDAIEGLRVLLKGGTAISGLESAFDIQRSLPHAPAKRKASTKRTSEGFPVQSFRTLITNLLTMAKHRVQPKLCLVSVCFDKLTMPTPLQQRALDLLGVSRILESCIGQGVSPIARRMAVLLGGFRSQGGSCD